MIVKGIRWVGIATDRYDEMRAFALETLGLGLVGEEEDFLETMAANGDKLELMGPRCPYPDYQFSSNPQVVGFLVDDIRAASAELAAAPGVELLGELNEMDDGYAWQHFRAPDGFVYELTFDPGA